MAGILQFTLGLEASSFLRNVGLASGQILSLAGVAQGLQVAMHGVWSAIERGGKLNDLAARTGETVKNLYQLEESFNVVGIGADSVAPLIFKLQQAMSGVTETGAKSEKIFRGLGLDFEALQRMDTPQRLLAIADALKQVGSDQAAGLASEIFGRGSASQMLQLARDAGSLRETLAATSREAEIFSRAAGAFDKIGDTLVRIQGGIGAMYAGIAEGVAPAIQSVLDLTNQIDFVRIGNQIGSVFTALIQAFRDGRLTELIAVSITTGFQIGLAAVPPLFVHLGELLLRVFQVPLAYLQAGIEYAIDQAVNNPTMRRMLQLTPAGAAVVAGLDAAGVTSGQASTFEDILKSRLEEGVKFDLGTGEYGIGDIADTRQQLWENFREQVGQLSQPLASLFDELLAGAPQFEAAAAGGGRGGNGTSFSESAKGSAFTSLESMGGIISGLGRGFGHDYARTTADNTRRTTEILGRIETKIGKTNGDTNE